MLWPRAIPVAPSVPNRRRRFSLEESPDRICPMNSQFKAARTPECLHGVARGSTRRRFLLSRSASTPRQSTSFLWPPSRAAPVRKIEEPRRPGPFASTQRCIRAATSETRLHNKRADLTIRGRSRKGVEAILTFEHTHTETRESTAHTQQATAVRGRKAGEATRKEPPAEKEK